MWHQFRKIIINVNLKILPHILCALPKENQFSVCSPSAASSSTSCVKHGESFFQGGGNPTRLPLLIKRALLLPILPFTSYAHTQYMHYGLFRIDKSIHFDRAPLPEGIIDCLLCPYTIHAPWIHLELTILKGLSSS